MKDIKLPDNFPKQCSQKNMPQWLFSSDNYIPVPDKEKYISKTVLELISKLSMLKKQKTIFSKSLFSASFKIVYTFLLILLISLAHNMGFLLVLLAALLVYICFFNGEYIEAVLKPAAGAAVFSFIIILPAVCMGLSNNFILPFKVFLTTMTAAILSRSIPFYLFTRILGRFHVPGIFITALELTIKYIVLLGETAFALLTALKLRSIGRNQKKYQSIGSVLGMTFIKSQEYARQTYNAMICRCFTGDYHIVQHNHWKNIYLVYAVIVIATTLIFLYTEGYLK
ncbi:energy-coupling factor transporter transmembrane component T [Pectinatus sottacetonis]|uniref:energy-coupling factor transporter transmembrane component T n=1 Tax=Pectinatus sottacetonis TaxID=1002795 RepID=UPI0018C7313A|nr:energy-coupling factor transporter transmembrane component T [Pectinatus sottacetonis]